MVVEAMRETEVKVRRGKSKRAVWQCFSTEKHCHTTGHAHTGAYYSCFVPTEPVECPCGEARQTRNHILLECEQYEQFRHLLGQHDEDRALDTLLGTDKGIACLTEFIEVTDAFAKVPFV